MLAFTALGAARHPGRPADAAATVAGRAGRSTSPTTSTSVLPKLDVVYLLRLQKERMHEALLPSLREYTATYGLTRQRARLCSRGRLIMHPGPVNRGVEMAAEVADQPRSVITRQVANGVAVRMAVLYLLLGSGVDLVAA